MTNIGLLTSGMNPIDHSHSDQVWNLTMLLQQIMFGPLLLAWVFSNMDSKSLIATRIYKQLVQFAMVGPYGLYILELLWNFVGLAVDDTIGPASWKYFGVWTLSSITTGYL